MGDPSKTATPACPTSGQSDSSTDDPFVLFSRIIARRALKHSPDYDPKLEEQFVPTESVEDLTQWIQKTLPLTLNISRDLDETDDYEYDNYIPELQGQVKGKLLIN